jgi:hypothetical protein
MFYTLIINLGCTAVARTITVAMVTPLRTWLLMPNIINNNELVDFKAIFIAAAGHSVHRAISDLIWLLRVIVH